MKEPQDNLQPETIDHLIDAAGLSADDHQTSSLIEHLHTSSQVYARENERSLDYIWGRLAQSQEHSVFLPAQWKQPEEKRIPIPIKERKVMQDTNTSWGMNSSPSPLQPKKRRSLWRVVGVSLVAAVAIITIVSFTIFSNILRSVPQPSGKGLISGLGAQSSQQQKEIRSAKQVCSFASEIVSINGAPWGPSLSWSSQGQIAVATYSHFKLYSPTHCTATFSAQSIQQAYETRWSPDGKKVLTVDAGDNTLYIFDNHGSSLAHLSFSQLGTLGVGSLVWSSDSNKIIFSARNAANQESVKSIDSSNNYKVATVLTLPTNSAGYLYSPGGKLLLVSHADMVAHTKVLQLWDVTTDKQISSFAPSAFFGMAFSPDGSLVAGSVEVNGGNSQIQIYSTANGKLVSSFVSSSKFLASLVWSPDGKYLAASETSINIYDVNAQKTVATFGQVDTQHAITALDWSPDSKSLVSSAGTVQEGAIPDDTVTVWALS